MVLAINRRYDYPHDFWQIACRRRNARHFKRLDRLFLDDSVFYPTFRSLAYHNDA